MSSGLRLRVFGLASLFLLVLLAAPPAAAPALSLPVLDGVWSPLEYPHPGVRQGTAVAYDAAHRKLYLFGGYDGAMTLSDTWVFDLNGAPVWTQIHAAGPLPEERQYHALVHDPVRHRLLLYGGYDGHALDDVWVLPLEGAPCWTRLAAPGAPDARFAHTATYDPVRDRLIVVGGITPAGPSSETWALSLADTPGWTQVLPAGDAPAPRAWHSTIYDPLSDALVVFGGFGGASGAEFLADVWRLDLAGSGTWSPLAPVGPAPAPRDGHAAVYDPAGPRMLVFGGNQGTARLDDVWALSLGASPAWDSLATSGTAPAPRFLHAAVMDAAQGRLLVMSGVTESGALRGDTWGLDLSATPTWSELVPTASLPPHMLLPAVACDPLHHRMIVFGDAPATESRLWEIPLDAPHQAHPLAAPGEGPPRLWGATAVYDVRRGRIVYFGGAVGPGTSTINGAWALELWPVPRWERLLPSGTPPEPRMAHAAIYDPVRDRMIVTGGYPEAGSIWAYQGVYALEFGDSLRWTRLQLADSVSVDRTFASAVYDPVRDRMVLYGGAEEGVYGEVWALTLRDTVAWRNVLPAGSGPVSRRGHTAVYDAARDRMLVFGGNTARFWGAGGTDLDDVWSLSLRDAAQWTQVSVSGLLPGARSEHAAVYDERTDRMVFYGGSVGGVPQNDAWEVAWTVVPAADVDPPATARLAIQSIRPNPVRGAASIAFSLPSPGPARLEVFDVAGRRVVRRDLAFGTSGTGVVRLDASTPLQPGLYFVRLEQGALSAQARMAVIR